MTFAFQDLFRAHLSLWTVEGKEKCPANPTPLSSTYIPHIYILFFTVAQSEGTGVLYLPPLTEGTFQTVLTWVAVG